MKYKILPPSDKLENMSIELPRYVFYVNYNTKKPQRVTTLQLRLTITRTIMKSRKEEKTMEENKLNFSPTVEITFTSGQFEDEEEHVIYVTCGYELFDTLKAFYEKKYEELFGYPVFHVEIVSIKYLFNNNDVQFTLNIGTDDAAQAQLSFNQQVVFDENAKKIAMIREVLDFDKEAECSLLRELFQK